MTSMLKIGCASVALLAATLTGAAQTQTSPPATTPSPPPATAPSAPSSVQPAPAAQSQAETDRAGPADNQIADEVDARIAQLKANLRLSADDDNKWPPLSNALRDYGVAAVKARYAYDTLVGRRDGRERDRDRRTDAPQSADDGRPNHLAIMRWEAEDMAARAGHLKKMADAAEPIYASLGDRQRRMLMRFIESGFDHAGRRAGRNDLPF